MAGLAGQAVTIARGDGAWVFDTGGRAYLDALASLWYCNVGHGRGELADAAAEQMRRLAAYQVFEPFTNPPAEELAPGSRTWPRCRGPRCSSPRAADRTR
jgi:adenosylmethionine-8-amino-7-oxononanoate aminotransferase